MWFSMCVHVNCDCDMQYKLFPKDYAFYTTNREIVYAWL